LLCNRRCVPQPAQNSPTRQTWIGLAAANPEITDAAGASAAVEQISLRSQSVRLKVDVIVALYVPVRPGGEAGNARNTHRDNRSRPGGNWNSRELGAARR